MTAAEVKDALRRRYPATQHMGYRQVPGPWTCIDELYGIDLIAFSAWSSPSPGGIAGVRYPRIAHEVKVSRSDLRRELLRPKKRAHALAWCNAFYLVVPKGLLTKSELAFVEPADWDEAAFQRIPCRFSRYGTHTPEWRADPGPCLKGSREALFIGPLRQYAYRHHVRVECLGCGGRGYWQRSRVELEAPTLWVPADCGLIEVDGTGCQVTRIAPPRKEIEHVLHAGHAFNDLIRWISVRPDPRHRALAS